MSKQLTKTEIASLVEQYESGNRSPLLSLKVFTACAEYIEARNGRKVSAEEMNNWDFGSSEVLSSAIKFLRKEYNLEPQPA